MTRAVKNLAPALLPQLKIPSAERFTQETPEQALLREALEALDAGTPPGVIARAMMSAAVAEEHAIAIVRTACAQLPIARHNAEMFLESRGEPQWCGAKTQRSVGVVIAIVGTLGAGAVSFGPQWGLVVPRSIMLLGEHTWTLGAASALIGMVAAALGLRTMKLVRRAALMKRP